MSSIIKDPVQFCPLEFYSLVTQPDEAVTFVISSNSLYRVLPDGQVEVDEVVVEHNPLVPEVLVPEPDYIE